MKTRKRVVGWCVRHVWPDGTKTDRLIPIGATSAVVSLAEARACAIMHTSPTDSGRKNVFRVMRRPKRETTQSGTAGKEEDVMERIRIRLADLAVLLEDVAKRRDPAWGASPEEAERGAWATIFPDRELPEGAFAFEIVVPAAKR